jgi:hypothetical protein
MSIVTIKCLLTVYCLERNIPMMYDPARPPSKCNSGLVYGGMHLGCATTRRLDLLWWCVDGHTTARHVLLALGASPTGRPIPRPAIFFKNNTFFIAYCRNNI